MCTFAISYWNWDITFSNYHCRTIYLPSSLIVFLVPFLYLVLWCIYVRNCHIFLVNWTFYQYIMYFFVYQKTFDLKSVFMTLVKPPHLSFYYYFHGIPPPPPPLFTFNLLVFVSVSLQWVSCRQHLFGSCISSILSNSAF